MTDSRYRELVAAIDEKIRKNSDDPSWQDPDVDRIATAATYLYAEKKCTVVEALTMIERLSREAS